MSRGVKSNEKTRERASSGARSESYHRPLMGRLEKRIFGLNDEISRFEGELDQARAELDVHRHLADDAIRDAAVSDSPFDREDARETTADVARFERLVEHLLDKIGQVTAKRDRMLDKLG